MLDPVRTTWNHSGVRSNMSAHDTVTSLPEAALDRSDGRRNAHACGQDPIGTAFPFFWGGGAVPTCSPYCYPSTSVAGVRDASSCENGTHGTLQRLAMDTVATFSPGPRFFQSSIRL